MKLREGYKQTEVGVIPEDWDAKPIGKACKLVNGRGFKPYEWKSDGLPIIRIQNLNGSGDFNYFQGHYDKKIEVEDGQLLFAWSGSRGTSFGPHIWRGPLGLLNYHTWKIVVDEKEVSSNYFLHALKELTKFIEEKAHGASALVHTQKWEMEGFEFPLPPTKAEQTAIANALSDADAWIQSLTRLITKKRQIKQGAMQTLLNPYKHGRLKAGWVVKKLGEISKIGRGRVISHKEINLSVEGKYPVFSSQTTNDGIMGYIDTYDFEGKYITWTTDGENAGKVFFRSGRFNCTNVCGTINLFEDDMVFVSLLLGTITPKHVSRNLANPKLMNDPVKKIDLPLPHISEQIRIATILSDMDADIAALESKLTKARQIKQGMMQNLLTGRIRLI